MKKILISTLALILIFISMGVMINYLIPMSGIQAFLNATSLLFLLINITLVIILSSSYQYLIKGFKKLFMNEFNISSDERLKIVDTYSMLIKSTSIIVSIEVIISFVGVLSILSDLDRIGPIAAVGVLSIFYGLIINLIFTIIKYKVKNEIV